MEKPNKENPKTFFKKEGLEFPFIPDEFKDSIRGISPCVFGTRKDAEDLYDIEWFVNEAISNLTKDYVLFGFSGHGTSSWAIHYYLVKEPLCLFLQLGWGGITTDEEYRRERIAGYFEGIPLLLDRVREAMEEGRIEQGKRLIIVESDLIGSGWTWINDYPGTLAHADWNTGGPAMLGAIASLLK